MFGMGGKTPASPDKSKATSPKSPAPSASGGGLKQSSVTPQANAPQNNASNGKKPAASSSNAPSPNPTRTTPSTTNGAAVAPAKAPAPRGSGSPERLSIMNLTVKLKATIRIQRCYRARRARKLAEAEQSWKVLY